MGRGQEAEAGRGGKIAETQAAGQAVGGPVAGWKASGWVLAPQAVGYHLDSPGLGCWGNDGHSHYHQHR